MTVEEVEAFNELLHNDLVAAQDTFYDANVEGVDDASPELVALRATIKEIEGVIESFFEDSEIAETDRKRIEEANAHMDGECSGLHGGCHVCESIDGDRQQDAAIDNEDWERYRNSDDYWR
jgi:hypothetical protein